MLDFLKSQEGYDPDFLEEKLWGLKYNVYSDHYMALDLCWARKGGFCSWHEHDFQSNTFVVIAGSLLIVREFSLEDQNVVHIKIGDGHSKRRTVVFPHIRHKFEALEDTLFLEVSGVKFSRDDIIRHSKGGMKNSSELAPSELLNYSERNQLDKGK